MKQYVITEYQSKVQLYIEDPDRQTRQILEFTWQEWSGLFWAVEDTKNHPNFKLREPRERHIPHAKEKEPFVKHILLEEKDAS